MATSPENNKERDATDLLLTKILRDGPPIALGLPLPLPAPDEPSDDELLALVEGTLPAAQKEKLRAALEDYPFSKDRVEILEEALAEYHQHESVRLVPDPAPAESPMPRLVFALISGAKRGLEYLRGTMEPLMLAPAAAPTRGAGEDRLETEPIFEFRQEIGTLDARVHLEGTTKGVEIRVALREGQRALDDGRATLLKAGKMVSSVRIREGIADFRGLEADNYVIDFKRQGKDVGQLAIDLLPA